MPSLTPSPAPQLRASHPAAETAREERVKMSRLSLTIARRLKEAQNTAAMLTTFNEVDMSAVMALRNAVQGGVREEARREARLHELLREGVRSRRCKDIPAVNAEIDGEEIVYKNYYHIGVAVGTDQGLVVPVVRDADRLSFAGIEKAIAEFGKQARDGQLQDRGHAGRHLHHFQWRRLWLADVDADPQCAAVGHSRHAQDPGAAGGGERARSSSAR